MVIMDDNNPLELNERFSNKIRIRVCGLLVQNDSILFVKHEPFGVAGHLWSPPGGGVEFGESVSCTLVREFKEEVGLDVVSDKFLFFHEHVDQKFHALELHFKVVLKNTKQAATLGKDPEFADSQQLLKDFAFFSFEQIKTLNPLTIHRWFLNQANFYSILN